MRPRCDTYVLHHDTNRSLPLVALSARSYRFPERCVRVRHVLRCGTQLSGKKIKSRNNTPKLRFDPFCLPTTDGFSVALLSRTTYCRGRVLFSRLWAATVACGQAIRGLRSFCAGFCLEFLKPLSSSFGEALTSSHTAPL